MSEWKEGGRDGWMDESQVHLVFSRSNNLFAPPPRPHKALYREIEVR